MLEWHLLTTTSKLISLFPSYRKTKKRPLEHSGKDFNHNSNSKRPKMDSRSSDVKCYTCGKLGHKYQGAMLKTQKLAS